MPRSSLSVFEQPLESATSIIVPCFFNFSDRLPIRQLFERPYLLFVENGEMARLQHQLFMLLARRPDFAVDLSSKSAYRHQVALAISDSIHHRFGIQRFKTMQIHTCLQEAIMNAIIHGNLEIESKFDTLIGFEDHMKLVQRKLVEPEYAARRITVAVWQRHNGLQIAVSDQGRGFSLPESNDPTCLPHGRGLMLIRSLASKVWVGDEKCTLWINFDTGNYAGNKR